MIRPSITSLKHSLLAAMMTVVPVQNALSAPGTLPTAPLFLSTLVEPNIFFTIDESGSMDWGLMVEDGVAGFFTFNGSPILDGAIRTYYTPDTVFKPLYTFPFGTLPPADGTDPEWDKSWVFRNHVGNRNYYNPNEKYFPWVGTEADGTAMYPSYDFSQLVPKDPNAPTGETVKLGAVYTFTEGLLTSNNFYIPTRYEWKDTDADGVIEHTDEHIQYYIGNHPSPPAGAIKDPDPDAERNFANWFVYHRSRLNAAKNILGRAINNTDAARMGMWGFNQDSIANVESMSDQAKKGALLKALYNLTISSDLLKRGTPTRPALEKVGELFISDAAGAPILSQAEGGECQQNFNILMTDGFWNVTIDPSNNQPVPGSEPSVGDADSDNNTIFDGDDGRSGVAAFISNDGGNYADGSKKSYANTLADVAMHYYETDLRPEKMPNGKPNPGALANNVPIQDGVDEADHQHLVNYAIGFGLKGTLDPLSANPLAADFTWPEPVANSITTVDDLWHAAYNSRGKYLKADDPQALQSSLDAAVTDIAQRTGTAAAVAINSAQLSLESVIYLAQFNSNRWQGNLLALPIVDTSTGELATTPKWDASALLTARDVSVNPRTIITFDNTTSIRDGVAFQWADISDDMEADLNSNAQGINDSPAVLAIGEKSNGELRLDYLRGDRSNEGAGGFRIRLSMLGDIVNSGPVFVGEPDLAWPDFAPFPQGAVAYSKFKNGAAKTRKKMVYVGANDGMLHAFDDDTGEEVFAYVPGMLSSSAIGEGLHYLTEPNYLHRFYVDETPAISDVFIGHGSEAAKWRTVLVGAMRSGARGLYALEVTDPAIFSEENADKMVLWELTNTDHADFHDLGYTYSRPSIAYANNNTWVAIFGNGYDPDINLAGVTGEASLYIVNIEKGPNGNWQAGDFKKITTGVGSTNPDVNGNPDLNGLATPALADVDGNGTVDRVYAGDLKGNMWAFDLEGTNSANWDVAYKSGSTPSPLFVTENTRPITSKPVLAKHPTQPDSSQPSNAPNIMVYFGTGQYLVDADKTTSTVESFYGVWDTGDSNLVSTDLIEQVFEPGFTDSQGNAVKVLSRNPVDYSIDHGWHFKLPETGERAVTSPIARADTVFFNTFVPVNDPCSVGGFGFRFAVDMTTGGSSLEPVFNSDDTYNTNVIDEHDSVSNGIDTSTIVATRQEGFLPEPVFIEDLAFTAKEATKVKSLKGIPTGRFSWQELLQ